MKQSLLLLLWGSISLFATEFFVSPLGNDMHSGTHQKPWATFKKAVSEVQSGDTLTLLEGVYKERLLLNKGSGPISDLLIRGEGDWDEEKVILDGTELLFTQLDEAMIEIEGKNNYHLAQINIQNCSGTGIKVHTISNVTVEYCSVTNTSGSGIAISDGDSVAISTSSFLQCSNSESEQLEAAFSSITLNKCKKFWISNNYVQGDPHRINTGAAIAVTNSADGRIFKNAISKINNTGIRIHNCNSTEVDSGIIFAERNRVSFCKDGISITARGGNSCRQIYVQNNLIYSNLQKGISVTSEDENPTDQKKSILDSIFIVCNTVVNQGEETAEPRGVGIALSTSNETFDTIQLSNNLIIGNSMAQLAIDASLLECEKLKIVNNIQSPKGSLPIERDGNRVTDVQFLDSANHDFHLSHKSPGFADSPLEGFNCPEDFYGAPRGRHGPHKWHVVNGNSSIGAIEYTSDWGKESVATPAVKMTPRLYGVKRSSQALHLSFDASDRPNKVELLDFRGRLLFSEKSINRSVTIPIARNSPSLLLLHFENGTSIQKIR